MVAEAYDDDLLEMRSYVDATNIKHVHRDEHRRMILAQVAGLGIMLPALEDTPESELRDFMVQVRERLSDAVLTDPEHAANRLNDAKNRYLFIA